MAAKKPSIGVKDFNELISCFLCKGYLIDATTVIECLHSFCKTCIINHLDSNTPKSRFCPRCDNQIHKTKPKLNIRSDPTLQDIVYKLVPGLYKNEMNRREEFYSKEPESAIGLSNEEKGEVSGERLIFTPEDSIYLAIEYFPQVISYALLPFSAKNLSNGSLNVEPTLAANGQPSDTNDSQRRYLKCEGGMRVLHLKKWLKLKYDVRDHNDIEILYKHDPLLDDYTMIDLAYIYSWRRNGPLCLYYKIVEPLKNGKDEGKPFKAPEAMKRRHTLKHRHKQQNNKKRKIIDESNLITTNPVNEPLPPVDSALIDRVMASNSIGTNLDLMTSVVNSALNMNSGAKTKQKPKKSVKTNGKTVESIKQMKKKIDKSLNKANKKSVPNKSAGDYGNRTNVDLTAGALNNTVAANDLQINKTANNSEPKSIGMEHKINGQNDKKTVFEKNSITDNIKKTFNSLSNKQLNGVLAAKMISKSIDDITKVVDKSQKKLKSKKVKINPSSHQNKTESIDKNSSIVGPNGGPTFESNIKTDIKSVQNVNKTPIRSKTDETIKDLKLNSDKIAEIMKTCLSNMGPNTNAIQHLFNHKLMSAISSPVPSSLHNSKPQTNGSEIKAKSKPKQKSNSNKPLNCKTTITPVPLPVLNCETNQMKSPTMGLFSKPVVGTEKINGEKPQNGTKTSNGLSPTEKALELTKNCVPKAIKSPEQSPLCQKSPVPLPASAYKSPQLLHLPAPDIFHFMPLDQNSSKCLPNMSKTDSNSDNTINNDIEVALNLSTSSKDKTT